MSGERTDARAPATGARAASRAALDVLLTDAAIEPATVGASGAAGRPPRDWPAASPATPAASRGARAVRRPNWPDAARRLTGRPRPGATGASAIGAGSENWLFRRLMQAYLALEGTVDRAGLRRGARLALRPACAVHGRQPPRRARADEPRPHQPGRCSRRRSTAAGRTSSRAPGASSRRRHGRLPATVDTSRFQVGGNLAVTEGSVVLRTDVFELIQYRPTTEQVYETPLLIVPPTINKYYIVDLAPGRSLVEHLVGHGHQVFCISWRNPDSEHGHFDFDTYADGGARGPGGGGRDRQAGDGATSWRRARAGSSPPGALGHLADEGRLGDVSSLTLLVCAIDNAQEGTA